MIRTAERRAMKFGRALRFAVVLSSLAIAGANAAAQIGIPGKFEVTPIGAASYNIPIQVPPGVGGMEPKLAFTYNSRAGNGVLGMGWSLTGLPAIARCPRTTPQDGVKGAVDYKAGDRFCLDGQRLVLTSGTYGQPGSTYATEIESFVKVTAFGSVGAGPQYFIVKTKDGQTAEFGNSTDSRVLVTDPAAVRVWAINRVTDNFGNAQTITYGLPPAISTSTTENNTYPLRIEYTSNAAKALPATNSVEFNYTTRPDRVLAYQGGKRFDISVRLSSLVIKNKTNGAVVTTYTPEYALRTDSTRSVMASLSKCAPDGLCAAAMQFGIGSSSTGGIPAGSEGVRSVSQAESSVVTGKWQSLDINNDGKTDLIHLTATSGAYRSWLSNGNGTFTIREFTTTADTSLNTGSWQVLDVNGDGHADLIHLTSTSGLIKVWVSKGDGEFAISEFRTTVDGDLTVGAWLPIDVNGDGLGDLVHLLPSDSSEPMRVWKSNGDGTFAVNQQVGGGGTVWMYPPNYHPAYNLYGGSKFQVFDVNGDGLADIIQLALVDTGSCAPNELRMVVRKSNGDGTFGAVTTRVRTVDACNGENKTWVDAMVPVDANQDGLMDFLLLSTKRAHATGAYTGENEAYLQLSKGDGTFIGVPTPIVGDPIIEGNWLSVDVNGDGLDDLVRTPANLAAGWYDVYRSNGDGTFTRKRETQSTDICSSSCLDVKPGDFLGTGAPGFVRVDGNTVKSAWLVGRPPGGLLTSVSNGLNNVTSWELAALPAMGSSYVRDLPSDSNTWTVAPAIPVVSAVRSRITSWSPGSARLDLERTTSYSYGSARVERNGRGFLGFRWLESKDIDTGLTSRTHFSQTFPTAGRAVIQGTGTGVGGAWNNLTLSTTTYDCTLLDGGNSCQLSPGKRYFAYPSLIDSQQWDLDGTPMPRTQVINSNPDTFGNLRHTVTTVLNPDGSPSGYSKTVDNEYYNADSTWIIGRLIKSTVTSTAPDVAAAVVPGSGNLPPAANPQLPTKVLATMSVIFQLLLSDD